MSKENTTSGEIEQCSSGQHEPLVIRHGSLFSGIGGFDLAAQWTGWENVFQVEIDDYCTKVLEKNFPNAKRYRDIRDFDGIQYRGTIDVVSGGFPCQPFSGAGKRQGKKDDRYLWPEMLRVLSEIKPRWIIGENVAGIIAMELDNMLDDLENLGYAAEPFVIPAASVDARHRRDRVWIIANAEGEHDGTGNTESIDRQIPKLRKCNSKENVADTKSIRRSRRNMRTDTGNKPEDKQGRNNCGSKTVEHFWEWTPEPTVGRVADGVPNRIHRLRALGNAIVPQVAFEIFRAIAAVSV